MVKDRDFDGTILLSRPESPLLGFLVTVYGDVADSGSFNRAEGAFVRAAGGERRVTAHVLGTLGTGGTVVGRVFFC